MSRKPTQVTDERESQGEINLQRVLKFCVLAEELSFTKAAQRMGLDQAWLSRQIQQLETDIGFQLFHRDTRRVELSASGLAFLPFAKELARVAERVHRGAQVIARAPRAEFRIGVAPFTFWVPARKKLTQKFEEAFEGDVQITSTSSIRLASMLLNGDLDVAIMAPQFAVDGLDYQIVHRSLPGLLVPSEDPLAQLGRIELSQLVGRRFASTDPSRTPAYDLIYGPLEAAGAIPVLVHEGRRALHFYARKERLIIVTQDWPNSEPTKLENFVHCEINPPLHPIEYAAVRQNGADSPPVSLFWDIAAELAPSA